MAFIIGAFLVYQKVYYESRDFYTENYEAFALSEGLTQQSNPNEQEGLKLYQEGQYELALEILNQQELFSSPDIYLYRGICKMETSNYWEAITDFQKLKETQPKMTQEAEWYKTLCLLGLERKEEVKEMLKYYLEQPDFQFNRERAIVLNKDY